MNIDEIILRKIETVCLDIIKDIHAHKPPKFSFRSREKWEELTFDSTVQMRRHPSQSAYSVVDTGQNRSLKKFAVMLQVLKIIYTLIQENRYCTKRDIFYQYPDYYSSQRSFDRIVDDIACMLQVPRWDLHVLSSTKGLVAGDLSFTDQAGLETNCQMSSSGIGIAPHMKDMQNLNTSAKFVLVVEKDATFQKLLDHQFCQKMNPCILITGKGFPDNGTRLLLKQLEGQFKLPIFILVDSDPHGIEIMAVYKYGSKAQAYDNQYLAVPQAEWIGIWPEDIARFNIKETSLAKMTQNDVKKAISLKKRPYVVTDPAFLAQIDILLESQRKAEIQCLDSISSGYLCDIYLPAKINLLYNALKEQ